MIKLNYCKTDSNETVAKKVGIYKWLALTTCLLASILLAVIPLAVNKANERRELEIRQTEITIQRQAIADYYVHANNVNEIINIVQNDGLSLENAEQILQQLIVESGNAQQALQKVFAIVEDATYLDDATVQFVDEIKSQMQKLQQDNLDE